MERRKKLILEEGGLKGIRKELRDIYAGFAAGEFLPTCYHDIFEYQELFRETRAHLESRYNQFKKSFVYRDCVKHLDLLEEIVYKDNPEGELN